MTRRTSPVPAVDVRRATDRLSTRLGWLDSRHSFSFGSHRDPANTHHGLLLVNNDDTVTPGTGFATHPHRDMEIVTWVLQGSLVHQDSEGNAGIIYPGLAQRMSAGTGILHSEKNDSGRIVGARHDEPVHFVQMWVVPDEAAVAPGYEHLEIDDELFGGGLVTVASGMAEHEDHAAIRIRNRYAALHAARLRPGQKVLLPEAPYLHLFVPRGKVALEAAGALETGDAARHRRDIRNPAGRGSGSLTPPACQVPRTDCAREKRRFAIARVTRGSSSQATAMVAVIASTSKIAAARPCPAIISHGAPRFLPRGRAMARRVGLGSPSRSTTMPSPVTGRSMTRQAQASQVHPVIVNRVHPANPASPTPACPIVMAGGEDAPPRPRRLPPASSQRIST